MTLLDNDPVQRLQTGQAVHWPTVIQLITSGCGLITLLAALGGLVLFGILSTSTLRGDPGNAFRGDQLYLISTLSWSTAFLCLLLAAASYYPLAHLAGWTIPTIKINRMGLANVIFLGWPVLVLAGYFISGLAKIAWIILPPLQVLVIAIPLWWLVELGRRGLQGGGAKQEWGIFSAGIVVTFPLAFIAEILLLMLLGVMWIAWLVGNPQALQQLSVLAQRLQNAGGDMERILQIILPYLRQPTTILIALGVVAGLIPMLEEIFKPLALWGWARELTPVQGYIGGLLCGGGFALVESLGYTAAPQGTAWAGLVVTRVGTGLLHITTAALMGWGLASAWRDGRYLHLGVVYLVVVAYHGLWNLFALALTSPLLIDGAAGGSVLAATARLGGIAPGVLIVLFILMIVLLVSFNSRLRAAQSSE